MLLDRHTYSVTLTDDLIPFLENEYNVELVVIDKLSPTEASELFFEHGVDALKQYGWMMVSFSHKDYGGTTYIYFEHDGQNLTFDEDYELLKFEEVNRLNMGSTTTLSAGKVDKDTPLRLDFSKPDYTWTLYIPYKEQVQLLNRRF